ncbi:unnamed protein product, partial [Laminaria digitata]
QILSGENWNTVMYDARRATGWVSVFYFVSLIIMGMMIVMNLFLAILLSNFTNKEDVDAEAGNGSGDNNNGDPNNNNNAKPQLPRGESIASPRVSPYNPASPPGSPSPNLRSGSSKAKPLNSARSVKHPEGGTMGEGMGGKVVPTANSNSGGDGGGVGAGGDGGQGVAARFCRACERFGGHLLEMCIYGFMVPNDLDPGRALFLLGPNNTVRMVCAAIVANPGFDRFILLLISVSSLALALDSPLRDPDSAAAGYLEQVEGVMNVLFFIEMTLKICAHGFVLMHGAYLRSAWNVLDFVVVVISMVQLSTDDSGNLESLRSLRTLRALRPLRYIWYNR